MAASPALSNTSTDTPTTGNPATPPAANLSAFAAAASATATSQHRSDPPRTLRGLNKPKCIQCGNVARSRCPYQSCKNCCSKAQNPCHIHVLKGNAALTDKTPSTNSPNFDQKSNESSPSSTSHRVVSLRQLSSNFAQFNNIQVPLRSRKPMTRKDAAAMNEWRFTKLKEHRDRNIEAENEAFDRYMLGINLLEEVLSMGSVPELNHNDSMGSTPELNSNPNSNTTPVDPNSNTNTTPVDPNSNTTPVDPNPETIRMKLKLRSNPGRTDNFRKRLREIIDQGLKKLQTSELNDEDDLTKTPKRDLNERTSALTELIDKLNKARNEDDLKSCLEMKSELFNRARTNETEAEDMVVCEKQSVKEDDLAAAPKLPQAKLFSATEIDQETLNSVDVHFSSLEQIEDL